MPAITNGTLKSEFARICPTLNSRGQNLSAEHVATVLVRTILQELGAKEYMTDEFKEERAELVKLVSPFITASKNTQTVHLSKTLDANGKPFMPECKGQERGVSGEFA